MARLLRFHRRVFFLVASLLVGGIIRIVASTMNHNSIRQPSAVTIDPSGRHLSILFSGLKAHPEQTPCSAGYTVHLRSYYPFLRMERAAYKVDQNTAFPLAAANSQESDPASPHLLYVQSCGDGDGDAGDGDGDGDGCGCGCGE
jgi:hypothetical protein